MPLQFSDSPPEEGPRLIATALRQLSRGRADTRGGMQLNLAGTGDPEQLELCPPQRVFQMSLEDVAAGGRLETATPVGWRYLIAKNGEAVESAEVTGSETGGY